MNDEFGIVEQQKGVEGLYTHIAYGNVHFNKSSFIKEWADRHVNGEIKTILDVGALDGGDSLRFSSWYPNATIYTVEGSPHNFDVMNKKLNNRKNINTFNFVMCDVDGFVDFYQTSYGSPEDYMIMGSIYDILEEKKARHNLKNVETISVQSITFDSFCKMNNITSVDVLHVDIEGATFNLLLGMNEVLPKVIFTEQEGNEFFKNKTIGGNEKLIELLIQKGYELVLTLSNDYLFVRKDI